jgi:hypothetical protein
MNTDSNNESNTDFWNEVNQLMQQNQTDEPKVEYRLYYDEKGWITSGQSVTEQSAADSASDQPYIVVSKFDYDNCHDKIVKDGVLTQRKIKPDFSMELTKSESGFKVVKSNAALLIDEDEKYSNVEHYAGRNS